MKPVRGIVALAVLATAISCGGGGGGGDGGGTVVPPPDPTDALPGGTATVFDTSDDAFGFPAPSLSVERTDTFFVGNSFFKANWVTAPSSTEGRDGLGPLFNAPSCSGCHLRDGRGAPPATPDERPSALLFKVALPGHQAGAAPTPDPVYGGQFQTQAILGVPVEGTVRVSYEGVDGQFGDGTSYSLRRPVNQVADLGYGPLAAGAVLAPRLAPPVFGLGLLTLVSDADLLAAADPDDGDGDGVSGRANYVPATFSDGKALGRFGWKAEQPTIEGQTAGAFQEDIGITTELRVSEACSSSQAACRAAPTGGTPEADATVFEPLRFYMHTLGVPARRAVDDPQVEVGRAHFFEAGCASCHTPTHRTGASDEFPELAGQVIHPYTDLLLHDLGPDLADGRATFDAGGSEWRTPPLWGLGLSATVSGSGFLLHDGRARDVTEAILWHGGEAEAAREHFRLLPEADRRALVRFVEDL